MGSTSILVCFTIEGAWRGKLKYRVAIIAIKEGKLQQYALLMMSHNLRQSVIKKKNFCDCRRSNRQRLSQHRWMSECLNANPLNTD